MIVEICMTGSMCVLIVLRRDILFRKASACNVLVQAGTTSGGRSRNSSGESVPLMSETQRYHRFKIRIGICCSISERLLRSTNIQTRRYQVFTQNYAARKHAYQQVNESKRRSKVCQTVRRGLKSLADGRIHLCQPIWRAQPKRRARLSRFGRVKEKEEQPLHSIMLIRCSPYRAPNVWLPC